MRIQILILMWIRSLLKSERRTIFIRGMCYLVLNVLWKVVNVGDMLQD
jgi:hypothetical protein